ncbi:MAG: hypothetical protein WAM44_14930 [Chthoniobacterales bacterium]
MNKLFGELSVAVLLMALACSGSSRFELLMMKSKIVIGLPVLKTE